MNQPVKIADLKNSIYRILRWGKAKELEAMMVQHPKLVKTALWQKKAVKLACYYGKVDCLRVLLANNGKLEEKYNKYTPIWIYALRHNSVDMLKIMEEHKVLNFNENNFRYIFYFSTQNKEAMAYLWQNYGATLGLENRVWRSPIYGRNLVTSWLQSALTLFDEIEAQDIRQKLKLVYEAINVDDRQNAFEAGVHLLWERQIYGRRPDRIKTMLAYQWQVADKIKDDSLVYALRVPSLDCAEVLLTDDKIVRDTKEIFKEKGEDIFLRLKPSLRMVKIIGKLGLDPVDTEKYSWLHRKSEQLATTTLRTLKKQHPEWLDTTNEQSKDTVWERVPVEKRAVLDKEELLKSIPTEAPTDSRADNVKRHRL